ncbi:MAG TPA: deoxynucleoside kinase [Candidatus Saccharicenans sp.]|nr:deoxynucleoside kinase [Candidatus Saccharicenans sp.]HQM74320.1 deoxynucleoside kinase [Candidatus Saccharicenans sp.]
MTNISEEIRCRHLAIEGVFKSRKTLLAHLLAQKIGGKLILDQTENPYLKDFYNEREGAAFLAQLIFLANRYHQQAQLVQRELFTDRIICDYLFEKDKIYAYQTLTDDELLVYERIYNILAERVPRPDLVIYLQISVKTLIKRIEREGQPLEKKISEKYLEDLVEAYDYFFFNYKGAPLLVVKADDLDLTQEEQVWDLIDQIKKLNKGSLYYIPQSFQAKKTKK